ncbi:glycolipid transfer protein domain-containing protein [Zopfochytrium polystomum]|nr:glycolipid transfer protein domain-containing protein [Zopfochytrium polystomum]
MATSIFEKSRSYSAVTIHADESIDVVTFLEATEGLLSVFDMLGSAFSVVKSDIQGNIGKIRNKYNEDPVKFATLQGFVQSEVADKNDKKKVATEGLLWLKRTLEFTAAGLRQNKSNPSEELNVSFNAAYGKTLAPFHNFLVRPVFAMAMKACPYRKDFYAKLGSDAPNFEESFEAWLKGLELIVTILVAFYIKIGM